MHSRSKPLNRTLGGDVPAILLRLILAFAELSAPEVVIGAMTAALFVSAIAVVVIALRLARAGP